MQPQAARNCRGLRSATSALLGGAVLPLSSFTCAAWGEERTSPTNPWQRLKYPLVSSLSEIQLGLIAEVPNPLCISDEKNALVHG